MEREAASQKHSLKLKRGGEEGKKTLADLGMFFGCMWCTVSVGEMEAAEK